MAKYDSALRMGFNDVYFVRNQAIVLEAEFSCNYLFRLDIIFGDDYFNENISHLIPVRLGQLRKAITCT